MVSGRGEVIEKLPGVAGTLHLVVVPPVGVDTGDAYRMIDEHRAGEKYEAYNPRGFYDEVRSAWLSGFAAGGFDLLMHNDFEEVIPYAYPEIAAAKNELLKLGVSAYMTGSGSAVFAPLDDCARALNLVENMRAIYGEAVFLCGPTDKGVEKID
jgi:4-diphosphocytidyl-2C-methyl-D-erythritol kinase